MRKLLVQTINEFLLNIKTLFHFYKKLSVQTYEPHFCFSEIKNLLNIFITF